MRIIMRARMEMMRDFLGVEEEGGGEG